MKDIKNFRKTNLKVEQILVELQNGSNKIYGEITFQGFTDLGMTIFHEK